MNRLRLLVLFSLLAHTLSAQTPQTDTVSARFDRLAKAMHLREPELAPGTYQVRLWVRPSFGYGDAQTLYVLDKTPDRLLLSAYDLYWTKNELRNTVRTVNDQPADTTVWQQLLRNDLLTLPDQSTLREQLYPKNKDSSWVEMTRGEVVVKAKALERTVHVLDGTSYRFEIRTANGRRDYEYSCPATYARVRTRVVELQQAVSLIKQIFALFGDQSRICRVYAAPPKPDENG